MRSGHTWNGPLQMTWPYCARFHSLAASFDCRLAMLPWPSSALARRERRRDFVYKNWMRLDFRKSETLKTRTKYWFTRRATVTPQPKSASAQSSPKPRWPLSCMCESSCLRMNGEERLTQSWTSLIRPAASHPGPNALNRAVPTDPCIHIVSQPRSNAGFRGFYVQRVLGDAVAQSRRCACGMHLIRKWTASPSSIATIPGIGTWKDRKI